MNKRDFYKYENRTALFAFRGLWKLKENKKGLENIISHLLSEENPFWKVKYFEKWRYKKIDKFNYEKDIRSDDRNDLIFYWEWEDNLLFKIEFRLEDRYLWKWEGEKLYSCNKSLNIELHNKEIQSNLLNMNLILR